MGFHIVAGVAVESMPISYVQDASMMPGEFLTSRTNTLLLGVY